MAIFFHETRETIDLLRRVVDKLDEKNGCISAEDLWDGVHCVPANVRSSDPAIAWNGIRQMERFSVVLQSLVSTYKAYTSSTRHRAHIPHLTITSLPIEIIRYIMEDAFVCTMPMSLIRLSHISSKIRSVILDLPSLWASIPVSLETPLSIIATIMSRSAALRLTVDISLHCGLGTALFYKAGRCKLSPTTFLSKLSTLFEHHQRWNKLRISLDSVTTKFILEHFPRVKLRSVRVLRVDDAQDDFFQKWEVPPLEELHWSVPREGVPPSSMATQTLRVCSLSLHTFCDSRAKMKTAAFLNAASNLHSLTLALDHHGNEEVPEIRLPCLERLDVITGSGIRFESTAILLEAILCPGLKKLYIQASTLVEYTVLTKNLRQRYPMLTFFTLALRSKLPEEDYFFVDIMRPLPCTIKNLRVKPKYTPQIVNLQASQRNNTVPYDFCNQYPNLTRLDLEDCTIPGQNFYAELSDILKNLRISLNDFRPGRRSNWKEQLEEEQLEETKDAILTLQRAGVLVDLYSTS